MNSPEQSTRNHVIRVFVSSTFRDMHDERNYLVKFIFPQLRKLCEQRGVAWGEVDLRWGVTDEQKAEGKVLPICLEEIKRCRPFFIGILGSRYGWVPEEIPPDLIESEEWLKKHHDHSVTELEILHGVLRNPEMTKHAFFYFRDSQASLKVEEELRKEADYKPESSDSLNKLAKLKDTIRGKGFPVRENYPDPKALGDMVLQDMTTVINTLYPEGSQSDPLDRDAADHETFAQSRARVYIGREEYFRELDEHVRGDGQPLVITGESGSGKSALLSNWALKFRKEHPGDFLLVHFIGASSFSSDWAAMLRRIMGEFKRKFDIRQEIPDKPDELRSAFANWLSMVSAKGRVILIIDALNQLEDRDGAPDLVWLPPVIPANVRMLLSTLPGKPLNTIKKRSWQIMSVEPLSENERKLFIEEYLKQYTKSLRPDLAREIVSKEQTANPLYLQALLEELRLFGRHEELEKHVRGYLEAKSIPDLFMKILERYEEDYESERPELVRDVMTCLWASRRGLQESELIDILGSEKKPLPHAVWTPLYLAAEHSLINRSGLINFSHEYFREAVLSKYIQSDTDNTAIHHRLSIYFGKKDDFSRMFDEFPWQLSKALEWQLLKDLLTHPDFFKAGWQTNKFDIRTYWTELESNTFSKVDAYRHVIDNPDNEDSVFVCQVALLMEYCGHFKEAVTLHNSLKERYQRSGDTANYSASINNLAEIYSRQGELGEAMKLYKEREHICREIEDNDGVQNSLNGQAVILIEQGDLNEAMKLLKEQEIICRKLGNKKGLQNAFGNQANIYKAHGELDEALKLLKEQECICQETGDKDGQSIAIGNQANIYYARGELDKAMNLYKELEHICRGLGDKNGLQNYLGNQALILKDRGELDDAMRLHKEKEDICREIGNKNGLSESLGNQAVIYYTRGEFDTAMRFYKEEEKICRELGNKEGLSISLNNQALIFEIRGELDEAMQLHKENVIFCEEIGNKNILQSTLGNMALILNARGETDEAMKLHKEKERICREIRNNDGLQIALGNQANIHFNRGEIDESMRLHKEEEHICREMGNKDGLSFSLGNQALIYKGKGELNEALRLYKEQECICRDLGNKKRLSTSLGNQATILRDMGELDEVMKLYNEQAPISRELRNYDDLLIALDVQANIHFSRREFDEAMKLYKEAESICREKGNKDGVQCLLGNQASINFNLGELDEAMQLYKAQEQICRELVNKESLQISLGNQALILKSRGDLDGAMRLYKEREHLCSELGNKKDLTLSLGYQALILETFGDASMSQNNFPEADKYFTQGLTIIQPLAEDNPENTWKQILSGFYDKLGNLRQVQGKLSEAEEFYSRAVSVNEQLSKSDASKTAWKDSLRMSYAKLSDVLSERGNNAKAQGNLSEAELCFAKDVSIVKYLIIDDPANNNLQDSYSIKLEKLGDILLSLGRLKDAESFFSQIVVVREHLTSSDPSNTLWQRDLGVVYWEMATTSDQVTPGEAGKWWSMAYRQFSSMKQRGILDPSDEMALAHAKTQAENHGAI
jgi:nephrocystin-3